MQTEKPRPKKLRERQYEDPTDCGDESEPEYVPPSSPQRAGNVRLFGPDTQPLLEKEEAATRGNTNDTEVITEEVITTTNPDSTNSSLVYSNMEDLLPGDSRVGLQQEGEGEGVDIIIANNGNPNMVDIPTPGNEQDHEDPVKECISQDDEGDAVPHNEEEHEKLVDAERESEEAEYDEPNDLAGAVDPPENEYATDPSAQEAQQQEPESVEYSDVQALHHPDNDEPVDEEAEPEILEIPELKERAMARDIDEYGNLLDENGHPIIQHAFPRTWQIQEDQGDGIIRFETPEGPVRFIMELGYVYENPPNEYKLQMDCYLKHIPTSHQIADGCHFFVDNGIWRLELDVEFINILLRMDVIKDFEDVTGDVIWNDSKEITIENLTKLVQIYSDSSYNEHKPRWLLMQDAKYNPRDNIYRLSDGTDIVNETRGMDIAVGMDMIQSETTFHIPEPDLTEMKNIKTFMIYDSSELVEHRIRYLDSEGCYVKETPTRHILCEDSTLEDQGKRHLFNEDCELADLGKRHLRYEDAEKVDIIRDVVMNGVETIENITRGFVIVEDSDRVDIKRHNICTEHDIQRNPAIWDKANFENELVDMTTMRLEQDIKLVISPSKFKLNQIEVDEEYLQEDDDD